MSKPNPILLAASLIVCAALAVAQENRSPAAANDATIVSAAALRWVDAPTLPPGAQMVILDGDPRKEGSFTMRLKVPAGYRIPPHTHPTAERLTVISGTVHLGFGEKFDESAGRELKAGDFARVPPGVAHFAWSATEAVLQIQSEGPFERKFVDPAAESTKAKK